jgi:hypothetical protein
MNLDKLSTAELLKEIERRKGAKVGKKSAKKEIIESQ